MKNFRAISMMLALLTLAACGQTQPVSSDTTTVPDKTTTVESGGGRDLSCS